MSIHHASTALDFLLADAARERNLWADDQVKAKAARKLADILDALVSQFHLHGFDGFRDDTSVPRAEMIRWWFATPGFWGVGVYQDIYTPALRYQIEDRGRNRPPRAPSGHQDLDVKLSWNPVTEAWWGPECTVLAGNKDTWRKKPLLRADSTAATSIRVPADVELGQKLIKLIGEADKVGR